MYFIQIYESILFSLGGGYGDGDVRNLSESTKIIPRISLSCSRLECCGVLHPGRLTIVPAMTGGQFDVFTRGRIVGLSEAGKSGAEIVLMTLCHGMRKRARGVLHEKGGRTKW